MSDWRHSRAFLYLADLQNLGIYVTGLVESVNWVLA